MNNPLSIGIFDIQSMKLIEYIRILDENRIIYTLGNRTEVGLFGHNIPAKELFISEENMETVKELFEAVDKKFNNTEPSFCPNCDGNNIEVQRPSGLLSIFKQTKYKCSDCDYIWI